MEGGEKLQSQQKVQEIKCLQGVRVWGGGIRDHTGKGKSDPGTEGRLLVLLSHEFQKSHMTVSHMLLLCVRVVCVYIHTHSVHNVTGAC